MFKSVVFGAILAAGLAAPAAAQTGRPADDASVKALLASWPEPARAKALKMIRSKGMPDAVTDTALIWDTGNIKRKRPKDDPTLVAGSILPESEIAEGGSD